MESDLQWISTNANSAHTSVLIYTDSQSLCEALLSSNPPKTSVCQSIPSISSTVFIQWIPGHSNIPGNDLADSSKKELPQLHQIPSTIFHIKRLSGTVPWQSTFSHLSKQILPTSQDFYWPTTTKKVTWMIYWPFDSILVITYHWRLIIIVLTKKSFQSVHHVSRQTTHYNIGLSNVQREMLLDNKCLGTTKGH